MKVLGLIGGMSWESTKVYYEIINREVERRLGGFHSCECVIYSFDFHRIEAGQRENRWADLSAEMVEAALKLRSAGAELIIICTNTMHLMADDIERESGIPLVHIADSVGHRINETGCKKVGLLGTEYTMTGEFLKDRLKMDHGLEIIIPPDEDRKLVHDVIFNELVKGIIRGGSRDEYLRIIRDLDDRGAEGVILGCTEIPLLLDDTMTDIPLFDTTRIHAIDAVDKALGE
ncbi:MAG: aspartate/glutamate racemase family protein [Thermoplasmatota archaeon]